MPPRALSKMMEFAIRLATHLFILPMGRSPLLEVEPLRPAEQAIPLERVNTHRKLDYTIPPPTGRQMAIVAN